MCMNINIQRVLDAKNSMSPIEESFNKLKKNNCTANAIEFMTEFRNQSFDDILKNMKYLYTIPTMGTTFIKHFVKSSNMDCHQLCCQKESLENFIYSLESANYIDNNHLAELKECVSVIGSLYDERSSLSAIKESTLMSFYEERANVSCVFESHIVDDLEVIIYNINYNPETISDMEKLVRKIKTSHTTEYLSSFPKLLEKSTLLVTNLSVYLTGASLDVVISIPVAIAEKIVEFKLSKSQVRAYVNIINKQIADTYKALKTGDNRMYNVYTAYMDNLRKASSILTEYVGVIKEGVVEMQPDIIPYEDGVVEDVVAELEDEIANLVFDDSEEFDEAAFENLIKIQFKLNTLCENGSMIITEDGKIVKTATKLANKVADGGREMLHKGRKAAGTVKRVATSVNKVTDPLVNAINNTLDKIKKEDYDKRRNRIITGQYRFKLFNFLSKGVLTIAGGKAIGAAVGGASLVNPLIGVISALTAIAIDKRLDDRARKKVLSELESELKIVEEKLEDAKGDGKREEKYQLMRIKQKLEKDIDRIKYRLDG